MEEIIAIIGLSYVFVVACAVPALIISLVFYDRN